MKAIARIGEHRAPFLKENTGQRENVSKRDEDRWSTFSPNATAYIPRPPGESIEAKFITHPGNSKQPKPSSCEIQWPKLPAWPFRPRLHSCISRDGKTWWHGRSIASREPRSPFVEYKEYRQGDAAKPCRIVPLQLLAQVQVGKNRKHRQGNHFLNSFELSCVEFVGTDAIRRNLETILKESNAPTREDDLPQRLTPVLKVAIPGKRHEDVREDEQQDGSHNYLQDTTVFRKSAAQR